MKGESTLFVVFMQKFLSVPGDSRDFHPCQCSYLITLKKQSWCQQISIDVPADQDKCSSSSNLGSDGRANCS